MGFQMSNQTHILKKSMELKKNAKKRKIHDILPNQTHPKFLCNENGYKIVTAGPVQIIITQERKASTV
jgi:hypothetical protein